MKKKFKDILNNVKWNYEAQASAIFFQYQLSSLKYGKYFGNKGQNKKCTALTSQNGLELVKAGQIAERYNGQ